MSLALTDDQAELAESLRKWAASLGPIEAARAAEADPGADFAEIWAAVEEMGVAAIVVPETSGGGGGSLLHQAVALEACAHELLPGGVLGAAVGTALTGVPGRYGVQAHPCSMHAMRCIKRFRVIVWGRWVHTTRANTF
jgi:alkylation response protein AidB-like acyl-CoA dehydrogenase